MPHRYTSTFGLIGVAVVTIKKSGHAQSVRLRGGGESDGRNLAKCVSNVWHMDFTKTSGNWCSNSKGYPDSFNNIPDALQPSAAECCAAVFPGQKCQVNRVCDEDKDEAEASQPSQQSVWKPGDTSESKPAARPTARPAQRNPAIPLTKYYLISSTGMCDTVGEKTPTWMTDSDFFDDWTECCKESWKFDHCLSRAPPGVVPEVLIEETISAKILYYSIPSSGNCVEKDEKTPSWMGENDFFSDYFDCCKASWNTDLCILEAPSYVTAEPTPSPSESPTPSPSVNPTMNPTAGPIAHTTTPISSKPTSELTQDLIDECDARLWHPSSDFSICSNSDDYDKSWDDPSQRDAYLYPNASGCCETFFEAWGKECVLHNVCTSSPTKHPVTTPAPTAKPTPSPNPLPSIHPTSTQPTTTQPTTTPIKYYQVFSTGVCVPLDAFTPYWMTETDFFEDHEECCSKSWNTSFCVSSGPTSSPTKLTSTPTARPSFKPASPPTRNPTSNPTPKPSISSPTSSPEQKIQMASSSTAVESIANPSCKSASWHPSKDYTSCTNSFEYPNMWNESPFKETFLDESIDGCCVLFFESWGRECVIEDICDVSSCHSAVWHPSEDYSSCSNSLTYSNSWNHSPLKESYLFESSFDCCYAFFEAWGKECVVEDTCEMEQLKGRV